MFALDDLGRGALPVHAWVSSTMDIEAGAMDQIAHLARFPFAVDHIAIMPDVHQGHGMPTGGVMATEDFIVPSAVGEDIGCGVLAMRTDLPVGHLDEQALRRIRQTILDAIPTGFSRHLTPQSELLMPGFDQDQCPVVASQSERARYQLGTLGGGNHFIELDADERETVWVLIHSGSRNLGLRVASHYNDIAKAFTQQVGLVPASWNLDVLPLGTEEGWQYGHEMAYCMRFAKANRLQMMNHVYQAINREARLPDAKLTDVIHNYAWLEEHDDQVVVVHRKGAVRAAGRVVIPGSQGTRSYIGTGLENEASWRSCSHGAGRCMSRSQAKARLNLAEEHHPEVHPEDGRADGRARTGVIHGIEDVSDLDEAPGAYKDIDWVMEQQADLVAIEHTLRPVMVVKG